MELYTGRVPGCSVSPLFSPCNQPLLAINFKPASPSPPNTHTQHTKHETNTGPVIVPRIKAELAACLARDGFASVEAAVGADHRKGGGGGGKGWFR